MTRTHDVLAHGVSRRCALLGVGGIGAAAALAACGGGGSSSTTAATATSAAASPAASAGGSAASTGSSAAAIAALSDVPVGGTAEVQVGGNGVLLSQPTAGKVEAFSSICPHQGGQVKPDGAKFRCSLHFSEFDDNGKVTQGPAVRNLTAIAVRVDGDSVVKA